jgi:pimeloyl-ACP methyl ester carboxylesterase
MTGGSTTGATVATGATTTTRTTVTTVTTPDGVGLHTESTGTGPAILFVHEFAADHRTWTEQVADLSADFRCIVYSARGYPPSDVPSDPGAYSYRHAAADAIAVLDGLGIDRAHVVGLSMGGYCALQLGILHPDRVLSLLVSSAGSGSRPDGRDAYIAETNAVVAAFRDQGSIAVAGKLANGPSRIQLRRKNEVAWQEFVRQLGEHSAEGMALTVVGVQQSRPSLADIVEDLRGITAPTLILNGDEDEACLEPGLLLKRTIATAGYQVVPNSGHALNLEEPQLYNQVIRRFADAASRGSWPTRDARSLSSAMGITDETPA